MYVCSKCRSCVGPGVPMVKHVVYRKAPRQILREYPVCKACLADLQAGPQVPEPPKKQPFVTVPDVPKPVRKPVPGGVSLLGKNYNEPPGARNGSDNESETEEA